MKTEKKAQLDLADEIRGVAEDVMKGRGDFQAKLNALADDVEILQYQKADLLAVARRALEDAVATLEDIEAGRIVDGDDGLTIAAAKETTETIRDELRAAIAEVEGR